MFNVKTLFIAAAAVFMIAAPLSAEAHDRRDRHDHDGWERRYDPPPGHWRHDHPRHDWRDWRHDHRRYVPPPPVVYVPRPIHPQSSFNIVVPLNLR